MLRLLKLTLPCSSTISAPRCSFASQTKNTAPSGSAATAIRPELPTGKGSMRTLPPASVILRAVSSALSTQMHEFPTAISGIPSGIGPTAPASRPPIRPMKYSGPPGGITFSNAYEAGDDNLRWLAVRIAMLDAYVSVDGPPELVGHLAELGGRLQRAGGPAPPGQ